MDEEQEVLETNISEDGDEFIVPPGAVEGSEESATEESETPNTGDAEVTEEQAGETREELVVQEQEVDPDVQAAIEEGKKILAYKKAHPGWDPFLMERDYREKTSELSRLKKLEAELEQHKAVPANQEQSLPDISDVNPEDIERLKKILPALGFVRKDDLEAERRLQAQKEYETSRKKELDAFLVEHPEYRPENDPDDKKWQALLQEYSLYKAPSSPEEIRSRLQRAHRFVKETFVESKDAAQVIAQSRVNKTATPPVSRASSSVPSAQKKTASNDLRKFLKGFSDEEIDEIANTKK